MKYKIFRCKKTGDYYVVLEDEETTMKNPETREWLDCVIYAQYMSADGFTQYTVEDRKTFVREKQEFIEKFEEVND